MKIEWVPALVAVLTLPLLAGAAGTAFAASTGEATLLPTEPAATTTFGDGRSDEDRAEESEQARRLRRARTEHEARRAEAAHKLEVEQAREREVARLRGAVSGLARRESFLHHEVYWNQRELDAISRDPADASAMARRGNVDRELNDLRNQLDLTATRRQGAMRQLDGARFR
jgi:hypothetical protein